MTPSTIAAAMSEAQKRHQARQVNFCKAASDGECFAEDCPQLRDSEPATTGRHCPLDVGCFRCCLPDDECEC